MIASAPSADQRHAGYGNARDHKFTPGRSGKGAALGL